MSVTAESGSGRRILGVLGGMGPEATADFFRKVVEATPASRDQDHIHVLINCDPSIPDRTAHILGRGPDPLPALIAAGRLLADSGANLGAVPCMTAHAYLEGIRAALPFPFVSAFEELAAYIRSNHSGARRIGVLATTGCVRSGLYERHLSDWRIHYPDEESQTRFVMEAIYGGRGIKAGNRGEEPSRLLRDAGKRLVARGADVLIAGCTEIPLVLKAGDFEVPLLDPMLILARAAVGRCLGGKA
ncbi:MAG TPA: amino acid racemase [Magnetospirillaceae bacterium]|nr:amino acid racemase [Magnetospirillaceae bacterium]